MKQYKPYTIYIGASQIVITASEPIEGSAILEVDDMLSVSRAKVVKKVETDKLITILTPDAHETFCRIREQFVVVEAAGGVVLNGAGELLMIRLRDRWDMPKGHIEEGESDSMAALREVEEETGIVGEIVGNEPLATTWHAYDTYGRWELKRTRWWQMRAIGGEPKAQTEEGVTAVRWCNNAEVVECLKNTYETIKQVVAALRGK